MPISTTEIRRYWRALYRQAKAVTVWVLSRDTSIERPCVVCLAVKLVGKPDAVAPHVRFDERYRERKRSQGEE